MSVAAKFLDPVVGIDIHMVTLPAPPLQAPLPHPFMGLVFDPIGAAVGAAIGAVLGGGGPVFVQGMPCGNTGTDVKGYPHFPTPPGVAPHPTDPPANEGTLVTGSTTVKFMATSESRLLSMVSTCGFPISLPTSLCMSIPLGAPVNIGGPEGLDAMAAVTRGIRTKWASGKLHKLAKAKPGSARSKFICFLTGHPVDVMTGELIAEADDFEIDGLIPVVWQRNYRSRTTDEGALGPGWAHPFDEWVDEFTGDATVERGKPGHAKVPGAIRLRLADGRSDHYGPLAEGKQAWNGEERHLLTRTMHGFEREDLTTGKRFIYRAQEDDSALDPDLGVRTRYRLVEIRNRAANRIQLRYERGYLTQVIDTAGRVLDIRWRAGDAGRARISAVMHGEHPLIRYGYDDQDMLASATDALGHAMRYAYKGGVMAKEVHKGGLTFHFRWDWNHPEGDCVRTWGDRNDGVPGKIYDRWITYDKQRHFTSVKDSRGTWSYFGNGKGLVDKQVDPSGVETHYAWDDDCRKVSETDGLGNTKRWSYDAWGNCTEEHDELGRVTRRAFTHRHQLASITAPMGATWSLSYGTSGEPEIISAPDGSATSYRYDGDGRLVEMTDPMGRKTSYAYGGDHTLTSITDGEGRTERLRCDGLGRLVWMADASGRETTLVLDAVGQPTSISFADGDQLWLTYDPDGNLAERADQLGRRERMRYVGTGQLAEYTDAMGYKVRLHYDGEEDLIRVVNQAGERYIFSRDKAGRIRTEITFDDRRTRLHYDAAGRLERTVGPPRTSVTAFEHDAAGQLVKLTATDAHMNTQVEEFAYDQGGMLIHSRRHIETAMEKLPDRKFYSRTKDVEVRFDRNALGQVLKESQRTGDGPWFDVESQYEPGGLRSQRDSSLGHRVGYAYDRAGDLSTVTLGLSEPFRKLPIPAAQRADWVMQITRTQAGEELARAFPGGVRALWKRDDKGRFEERRVLTGVRTTADPRGASPGADVLRTQYAWRSSEQIASLSNLLSGDRTDYEHDDRGHLIRETRHKRSGQASWRSEVVPRLSDQVGNLFRQPDFKDAEYGKNGQLLRWGQNTYVYDDHGRLSLKTLADGARWLYRWSPAGRLLEVERPDGKVVEFEYDTFGRRTQKRFDGEVTTYVWDGNDLLHQQKRLADGTLAPLSTWVFEPDTFAPIAKVEGNDRYAVVNDHLGVPQLLTDEKGAIAWKAQLDVYGVPRDEASTGVEQPVRLPGQLFDAETGLFYNRHRYYDAETGRYVSEDPLGVPANLGVHRYPADPTTTVDPFGLVKCSLKKRTKSATNKMRQRFDNKMRRRFLKRLAKEKGAADRWGPDAYKALFDGKVPKGMEVHHLLPLSRGGTNSGKNLALLPKSFHRNFYDTLHNFPDGLAPGALLDHAVREGVLKDSGRLLRYL